MDQVQQVLVQTLVKEEQSIVPQEHLLVALYQMDITQQDAIVQIIIVKVSLYVDQDIFVKMELKDLVQQIILLILEQLFVMIIQHQ